MNKDTQDAAQATAEWWASKVFGGSVGDAGPGTGMTMALAVLAGAQGKAAEPSKRDEFVSALADRVRSHLERFADSSSAYGMCLAVDYGPEPPLSDVARQVGVSGGSFPWKTMTHTYPTHATASLGYGAGAVLIWQAEGWERPACGQGKYNANNYDRDPWKCGLPRYHEGGCDYSEPDPLCAGIVRGISGETEPCLRPAGHHWHKVDDDYPSANAHDYWTAAEAKA